MSGNLTKASKLVDEYLSARAERLEKAKELKNLEEKEGGLKKTLIDMMIESGAKCIGGSKGVVNRKRKYKPTAKSWDAIYDYIWQNRAFDLLQKRLAEAAVKLRWDDQIPIPGVEAFPVDDLTVSGEE
jgi:hypothetical protein